jgi:hypothetical protein
MESDMICRLAEHSRPDTPSELAANGSGKPQFGHDTSRFVETWQLSAGLEFERAPVPSLD